MYTYFEKALKAVSRKRRNDVAKISEATGYSHSHVSNTLAGRRFNDTIINTAYDITRRRMANDVKITALEA
jgi:hypothetical protein